MQPVTKYMQYCTSKWSNIRILANPRIVLKQRELITICKAPKFDDFPRFSCGCGVKCESSCEVYDACASGFTPRDDHFSSQVGKYSLSNTSQNVNLCDFQDLMTTVLRNTTTSSTASQVGAMQLIGKCRGCATPGELL